MGQPDAWRMIRKRAAAVGIFAPVGNHSFRATGITAHLSNGGALEHAQEMAAHESPRTTKLYDRTKERLTAGIKVEDGLNYSRTAIQVMSGRHLQNYWRTRGGLHPNIQARVEDL